MPEDNQERLFRQVDHVIALARIVAENEPHSEVDISVIKAEYLAEFRKDLKEVDLELPMQDIALITLAQLFENYPTRKVKAYTHPCQN